MRHQPPNCTLYLRENFKKGETSKRLSFDILDFPDCKLLTVDFLALFTKADPRICMSSKHDLEHERDIKHSAPFSDYNKSTPVGG